MSAPFAAFEATANASVLQHLSNAIADVGGAVFPVIFDEDYVEPLGVASTGPACTCAIGTPGVVEDACIAVDRTPGASVVDIAAPRFVIVAIEPDGGLVRLRLREDRHG